MQAGLLFYSGHLWPALFGSFPYLAVRAGIAATVARVDLVPAEAAQLDPA